jgi:hypothetical protein
LSKLVSNVRKVKQTNSTIAIHAAHSLDFRSSRLHVFRDVRHCKRARLFATPALSECQWKHSPEVRLMTNGT